MKKFILFLLGAMLLLHLLSCKKEVITGISFEQITTVDSLCEMTGTIDPTDWSYDSTWTTVEQTLLTFIDPNIILTDSLPGRVTVYPACANPNNGVFHVDVFTQRECEMRVAFVNNDFQILQYQSLHLYGGLITNHYDFRYLTAFHPNAYYRMYYAFFDARDSMYYQGHGDLFLQ